MPCWVAKEKRRCNGKGAKMGCDQNTDSNFKLGPVLLHQLAGRTGGERGHVLLGTSGFLFSVFWVARVFFLNMVYAFAFVPPARVPSIYVQPSRWGWEKHPPSLPGLGVQIGRAGSVPKGRVSSTAAPRGSLRCAGDVNEQLPGALLLFNPLKL